MHDEQPGLSRRRMVAIGALGGLGGAALAGTGTADAIGVRQDGPAGQQAPQIVAGEPAAPRIGSAPITGFSYRHLSFMDFQSYGGVPWSWTETGIYTTGNVAGQLGATLDLPAGAILRDIEFYYAASTPGTLDAALWTSGWAKFSSILGGAAPATGDVLKARRLLAPLAKNGPYALGAKLMVWAYTSATFRINGARVGFSAAPAGAVLLPVPLRVYDSRTGGGTKIGNGQTRVHDLSSWVPPVATAAILNVSVTGGEKSGGLAVYHADLPAPSGSALYFNGSTTLSNELHTGLTATRRCKATMRGVSGSKCHYFVDLVGYTA